MNVIKGNPGRVVAAKDRGSYATRSHPGNTNHDNLKPGRVEAAKEPG